MSDFLLLKKRSNLIPLIYTKKGMIFYFFNFWTEICQFVQCAGASKPTLMYVVPTSSTYQKWEHGKNGSWGSSSWEVKVKATSAVASQFSLSLNSTTLYLVNIFSGRELEFSPSFLFITDLSEYWNSALFPTIVVISLLIVADIFVSVFYMGESARQRRRLYSLRNYYRRRNFGAPKTRHGHHHHHAIGRMGYSEEAAENPDEYQRSE